MAKDTQEEVRQPYTHIINIKGNDRTYFASDCKEDGENITFTTCSKDGRKFKRTVAKTEISDIAQEIC